MAEGRLSSGQRDANTAEDVVVAREASGKPTRVARLMAVTESEGGGMARCENRLGERIARVRAEAEETSQ